MAGKGGRRSTSFKKGQSGNPKGRPKQLPPELMELARSHTKEAIETLVVWMKSDQGSVAVAAADKLLSRGWGLPKQVVEGEFNVTNYYERLSDEELDAEFKRAAETDSRLAASRRDAAAARANGSAGVH
jgi:hypothetical protein